MRRQKAGADEPRYGAYGKSRRTEMKTNRKSEMKTQRKTGTMAKNKAGRTGLLRKGIIMVLAMAAAARSFPGTSTRRR